MTLDPNKLVATILELHERSRGAALDEFQDQAFDILHRLVRFDTAIWGLGADAGEPHRGLVERPKRGDRTQVALDRADDQAEREQHVVSTNV